MANSEPTLNSLDRKIEIVIARFDAIDRNQTKMESQFDTLTKQMIEFNKEYISGHVTVENKINAAHIRLDSVESSTDKRLTKVEDAILEIRKVIIPIISWNKIITFIVTGFAVSVIGLIWALIIGQVQLVFP